jgi:ABC-type hemin transport system substrate-binding protein
MCSSKQITVSLRAKRSNLFRLSYAVKDRFVALLLAMTGIFLPLQAIAYSRIISLKPNITEIVFALGAGNQLVGVTRFCQRPPEAAKLPRVADYVSIDVEKTLAQRPDLILASMENASRKEVEFL